MTFDDILDYTDIIWVKIGLFFAGSVLVHFLLSRVYKRLEPKLRATSFIWDNALLKAVYTPFILTVWGLTLFFIGELFFPLSYLYIPLRIGLVFVVLLILLRFIKEWELGYW